MLDAKTAQLIDESVLCWLATVSKEGTPSVSPKEIFVRLDDRRIAIANIASPGSAAGIRHNPAVCVSVLKIFSQRGVQMKGQARIVGAKDADFEELAKPLRELAGPSFPFASLFEVTVSSVKPILAPRYTLFPDTTEGAQIGRAMESYGVQPLEPS